MFTQPGTPGAVQVAGETVGGDFLLAAGVREPGQNSAPFLAAGCQVLPPTPQQRGPPVRLWEGIRSPNCTLPMTTGRTRVASTHCGDAHTEAPRGKVSPAWSVCPSKAGAFWNVQGTVTPQQLREDRIGCGLFKLAVTSSVASGKCSTSLIPSFSSGKWGEPLKSLMTSLGRCNRCLLLEW